MLHAADRDPINDTTRTVSAGSLKAMLRDAGEIAVLDVREAGEFAEGHLFLAVSAPYSRFEPELVRLVPRTSTRVVLCDDGSSDRAMRAAARALDLGYTDVSVLLRGIAGWREAGYELFEGVHVPSKTFGEILEHACHVPSIRPEDLAARQSRGERILVLDGRPLEEHQRMSIPGSICLPNGDLPYRIELAIEDDTTPIVVHCAGRTRSIVGAQTLRHLGLKNPVFALENGTQGWTLAGLELEYGSHRHVTASPDEARRVTLRRRARDIALRLKVPFAKVDDVRRWVDDQSRTTYLIDVRSPAEFARSHAPGAGNAPGGQLVQATDLWLGTRGARVVLVDDIEVRSVMTAAWLRQMGWEAFALAEGEEAWKDLPPTLPQAELRLESVPPLSAAELMKMQRGSTPLHIIDLRPSMAFRKGHLCGAAWSTRSRIVSDVRRSPDQVHRVVLVTTDDTIAALAARDLIEAGLSEIVQLKDGPATWEEEGLVVEVTPDEPSDRDCIDYVFFTHDRHNGNLDAARRYLTWETGLAQRIDEDERLLFQPYGGQPKESLDDVDV